MISMKLLKVERMENNDIKLVFDALLTTPLAKRLSELNVVVKCPICGEGHKKHDHGHCYIGLINGQPPVVYHCFIGECSGIVTPEFLHSMEIFDNELDNILNLFNKSYDKLSKESYKIYKIQKKKDNLIIPDIRQTNSNINKLNYLRNRMKINFSLENCKNLRIIFSLYDFLDANNIKPNLRRYKKRILDIVDDDYIGFVAANNSHIVFRNTKNNKNLRYLKYEIFDEPNLGNIIYTIPGTKCDLFSDDVNLNVAEGTFDILGVYNSICHGNKINNIYAACCGSGYTNTIKYFIKLGFIGNLNINIYSDKDKKPEFYRKMYYEILPWVKSINIYYNDLSKDYGVPREEIQISKIKNSLIFRQTKER